LHVGGVREQADFDTLAAAFSHYTWKVRVESQGVVSVSLCMCQGVVSVSLCMCHLF
jgi:hypothetical protein